MIPSASMMDLESRSASPTPLSLGEMPVEVIEIICSQFHHPVKQICWQFPLDGAMKALASLCQTSKRLHEIALPHLYRFIHMKPKQARLVPFTRSLLCNQHLGGFVRQIGIEKQAGFERDQVIQNYFASQQADLLAGEVVGTDGRVTGCGEWYAIRILDLLLSKLRNIEYLALEIHDRSYRGDCFTYIRDKHLDDAEFLHQLKEVMVYNDDRFKVGSTTALLSVTPLQKMLLYHCSHLQELNSFCLPSLLELRLYEPYLDRTELIRLLKSCPNLRLFWYEKVYYPSDDALDGFPEAKLVGGGIGMSLAVRHLKKRLQTLSLSFHNRYHPDKTSMASFAEFSNLQNLTIETYALAGRIEDSNWVENQVVDEHGCSLEKDYWGEDIERIKDHTIALQPWMHKLPSSLQFLHIRNAMDLLKPGFSVLAERAKDDLPNLKILVVDGDLGFHDLFRGTNIEYIERDHLRYHEFNKDIEWD